MVNFFIIIYEDECPDEEITGKCRIGKDPASDNYEWIEYRYDDNDVDNETACVNTNGEWCNY